MLDQVGRGKRADDVHDFNSSGSATLRRGMLLSPNTDEEEYAALLVEAAAFLRGAPSSVASTTTAVTPAGGDGLVEKEDGSGGDDEDGEEPMALFAAKLPPLFVPAQSSYHGGGDNTKNKTPRILEDRQQQSYYEEHSYYQEKDSQMNEDVADESRYKKNGDGDNDCYRHYDRMCRSAIGGQKGELEVLAQLHQHGDDEEGEEETLYSFLLDNILVDQHGEKAAREQQHNQDQHHDPPPAGLFPDHHEQQEDQEGKSGAGCCRKSTPSSSSTSIGTWWEGGGRSAASSKRGEGGGAEEAGVADAMRSTPGDLFLGGGGNTTTTTTLRREMKKGGGSGIKKVLFPPRQKRSGSRRRTNAAVAIVVRPTASVVSPSPPVPPRPSTAFSPPYNNTNEDHIFPSSLDFVNNCADSGTRLPPPPSILLPQEPTRRYCYHPPSARLGAGGAGFPSINNSGGKSSNLHLYNEDERIRRTGRLCCGGDDLVPVPWFLAGGVVLGGALVSSSCPARTAAPGAPHEERGSAARSYQKAYGPGIIDSSFVLMPPSAVVETEQHQPCSSGTTSTTSGAAPAEQEQQEAPPLPCSVFFSLKNHDEFEVEDHGGGDKHEEQEADQRAMTPRRFYRFQCKQWTQKLEEARAFAIKHGHCRIPHNYPENQALAKWAHRQRQEFKKYWKPRPQNRLPSSPTTIIADEDAPRSGGGGRGAEQEKQSAIPALAAARQGELLLPPPSCSTFTSRTNAVPPVVHRQRDHDLYSSLSDTASTSTSSSWSPSSLTMERIQMLDEIGFAWDLQDANWTERLDELKAFKAQHGHVNVPRTYPPNRSLSTWVLTQRSMYSKGSISEERVRLLNQLGFCWSIVQDATNKRERETPTNCWGEQSSSSTTTPNGRRRRRTGRTGRGRRGQLET